MTWTIKWGYSKLPERLAGQLDEPAVADGRTDVAVMVACVAVPTLGLPLYMADPTGVVDVARVVSP